MSNELDPHHLVALMSHEFEDMQEGSSRRLDPSSHSFKYGIVDNHATNVRTFPILDAIANISVSREYHQVIAVALQLDSQKKAIRLSIAENQSVSKDLLDHLRRVWRNLQTLSNEYAVHRTGESDKPEYQVKSPPMPMNVALTLKIEIFRDIYLYTLKKQMRRIKKWFKNLGHFTRLLIKSRGLPNLQGFEVNLYKAVIALFTALKLVYKLGGNPRSQLSDEEWRKVYMQSMKANEDVKVVLAGGDGTGCEDLANELKDYFPNGPFDLRRALVKLTSLPQHIESLFGFAHSPRFRPLLLYRISIIGIPKGRSRNVKLPSSPSEWKLLLETACQQSCIWQEGDAAELSEKFRSQYMCTAHCECKLIQFHKTARGNQWGGVPPFSYIGVSKLSCSACHIWIAAFNKLGGQQFYTRGSCGKWYWPWGMPRMGGDLDSIMAKEVLGEYIAHQRASGRLRSSSESTSASPSEAQHGLSDDHCEEAVTDSVVQKEFGGDVVLFFDTVF